MSHPDPTKENYHTHLDVLSVICKEWTDACEPCCPGHADCDCIENIDLELEAYNNAKA